MSHGPRVLFVIPGEATGSSMVFARRQADALRARGIEVESFHLRSRTSPRMLFAEGKRFLHTQQAVQPDIVHAHFGTVTALFTVLLSRAPVVITYRGSDLNPVPSETNLRAFLGRALSQLAALGASRIVCVSRKLRDRLWWRKNVVTVLPSGVDTTVFRPVARSDARAQLDWPPEQPVVLFNVGHDPAIKRLDLARAAIVQLQLQLPQARLEELTGGVPPSRIPLYMNAADCLLVTSDAEGSPTVVQEALATHLPVVSVDVGDVAERLQNIPGCFIAARDPRAIASALFGVLRNPTRLSGAAPTREIDAAHIADELAHLYLETVALAAPQKITAWNTTLSSPR